MEFKFYLLEQIKKHPTVMPQDIVKACYQAAFGAEHLLSDVTAAKNYFYAEYNSVEAREGELLEFLSDGVCRVDLGVWKARGLSPEKLFEAFVGSASVVEGGREAFEEHLKVAEECVIYTSFSLEEWKEFIEKYRAAGCPAVHHSERFRADARPSYRIVRAEAVRELLK